VHSRLPGAGDNLAYHILTRCGGDLAAVAAVCAKAALFPESLSQALVDAFCMERPADSFADALLKGDKRAALAAAGHLASAEFGQVTGLLESRLDVLSVLHTAVARGMAPADMRSRLRLPQFVVARYRKISADYTADSVRNRRAVLATADAAWRRGAAEGLTEYLVALW
jgi:hypothetical protein